MNQSINTDSKNSKEPQQKYRLGTVSIKILGGLNRFYRQSKFRVNVSEDIYRLDVDRKRVKSKTKKKILGRSFSLVSL